MIFGMDRLKMCENKRLRNVYVISCLNIWIVKSIKDDNSIDWKQKININGGPLTYSIENAILNNK